MQDIETKSRGTVLTQGTIIKVVEELNFGVIQAEDNSFLFFHISNFNDENITMDDLKEGDVIMCERQEQRSDGKDAAINCQRVEIKGYLKDYFINNALVVSNNVEYFDQFCENCKEYSSYLKNGNIEVEDKETLSDLIESANSIMKLKLLRPKIAMIASKYADNKTAKEFFDIMDELIKAIKPNPGATEELENFKRFSETLFLYMN